jgi:hypothetical protein
MRILKRFNESSSRDFERNYRNEIEQSIFQLSEISKVFFNLNNINQDYIDNIMKRYDRNVLPEIEKWLDHPNNSSSDIIEFACNNSYRYGTEPQMVLFAIEDIYNYLMRVGLIDEIEDEDNDYSNPHDTSEGLKYLKLFEEMEPQITGIEMLVGKTLVKINNSNDEIRFYTKEGRVYLMHHQQDCCESVSVEDIVGDLDDLIGSPVITASEDTSNDNPNDITKEYQDCFTWTFYNIATQKGHVTIRWYGESNGYYSERVDFEDVGEYNIFDLD